MVAYVMIVVSLFIVINLVVDVLTYTFDPRRRMAGGEAELAANGSVHPVTVHDGR